MRVDKTNIFSLLSHWRAHLFICNNSEAREKLKLPIRNCFLLSMTACFNLFTTKENVFHCFNIDDFRT